MNQIKKDTRANTTGISTKIDKYPLSTKIINLYAVINEKIIPMQEDDNENRSVIGDTLGNIIRDFQTLLYNSRAFMARIKTEQRKSTGQFHFNVVFLFNDIKRNLKICWSSFFIKGYFIPIRSILINLFSITYSFYSLQFTCYVLVNFSSGYLLLKEQLNRTKLPQKATVTRIHDPFLLTLRQRDHVWSRQQNSNINIVEQLFFIAVPKSTVPKYLYRSTSNVIFFYVKMADRVLSNRCFFKELC